MAENVAERLARFASAQVGRPAAREVMRLSLMDWAAVGLAGRGEPVAQILRAKALEEGGAAEAALFGGGRVPAAAAALANGACSHALDYDDTHFAHIGHPSVAVLPAALALCMRSGQGLEHLLDAALVGAEASVRVGLWLGRGHYQAGFHQTATAGSFGAAVAACRILGLEAGACTHAMGLAATRAAGLKGQFGTMGKPLNAGLAAEAGVQAAQWAGWGMTSAEDGLGGVQGFGETHHGAADESAWEGMGTDWLMESVSHKFHACCHGLHAMLEAIGGLELSSPVQRLVVFTHPRWLRVCNIARPETGLEVKFSYAHTAAMALSGVDTARIGNFSAEVAADPGLVALAGRVVVEADEALPETAARVVAELEDGSRVMNAHDLAVPAPLDARRARVRAKAAALLGEEAAEALWEAVNGRDLAPLVAMIEAPLS